MGSINSVEQKFLGLQEALFTKELEEIKEKSKATWEKQQPILHAEIMDKLRDLNAVYAELQRDGQVCDVKYIQFSFLRTGVLLNMPWYRIELYDKNWRITEVECAVSWQPLFLTKQFYEIAAVIEGNFQRARVARYHYESMLFKAAKELHQFLTLFLADLFAIKKQEKDRVFPQPLDVYCGEFLDECRQIFYGRL